MLPQRQQRFPICPLLIDMGSSRAVTLSFLQSEVLPSFQGALRQILASWGEQGRPLPQLKRHSDASLNSWIRPCGFSPERPLLQHESWKHIWQAYICSLRRPTHVSNVTLTSAFDAALTVAETTDRDVNTLPFFGTSSPTLLLDLCQADVQGLRVRMEFFRVDAFIPVHVQMYHVVRRVMEPHNLWDVVAIGIVAPAHRTEYFVDAAVRVREGVLKQSLAPSFLVYDHKGLHRQLP